MLYPRVLHTATLLNSGDVLITGGEAWGGVGPDYGTLSASELYHPAFVSPAPALFSLPGDGQGQGAVWHRRRDRLFHRKSRLRLVRHCRCMPAALWKGGHPAPARRRRPVARSSVLRRRIRITPLFSD